MIRDGYVGVPLVTSSGVNLSWKEKSDNDIGFATLFGSTWTPQVDFSAPLSDAKPTLSALGASLFLAWKGQGNTTVWFSSRI